MITVNVSAKEQAKFQKQIKELIAVSDKPVEGIMRDQGRLLCKDLSFHTDRYGHDKFVFEKHKKDTEETINAIYKDAELLVDLALKKFDARTAQRFTQYITSGDPLKIQQVSDAIYGKGKAIAMTWDNGAAHRRWKTSKRKPFIILIKGAKKKATYINKKKALIGNAKAGWARAAVQIGGAANPTRGIPAWAKKKSHLTKGLGLVSGAKYKTNITVANYSKYGMSKGALSQAFRVRIQTMQQQVIRIIKASHKKSQAKYR